MTTTNNPLPPARLGERGHRWLRRIFGGLAFLLLTTLSFSRMAGGSVVTVADDPVVPLVGTVVRYALPDGDYVEREFIAEDHAHWRMLTGAHAGEEGDEAVKVVRMGASVYFVNRVDPLDGDTLSEVYNLATQTVAVYVTQPDPEDPTHRLERSVEGRLEIVSSAARAAKLSAEAAAT